TRLHFHEFMRGVHQALKEIKSQSDPLDAVAKDLSERYHLICFDEFHVSDIADAMILYNLLQALFRHEFCFIIISNYVLDTLYPDSFHREWLLSFFVLFYTCSVFINGESCGVWCVR